ncbi:hypothetical protein GCM10023080_033150 [Streptomyces pseudoechinosporeus]
MGASSPANDPPVPPPKRIAVGVGDHMVAADAVTVSRPQRRPDPVSVPRIRTRGSPRATASAAGDEPNDAVRTAPDDHCIVRTGAHTDDAVNSPLPRRCASLRTAMRTDHQRCAHEG